MSDKPQINLFDYNFKDWPCSTAYQEPSHFEYVRDQMVWDGVTIFTDAFIVNPIVDQVQSRVKIAWLHEPGCIHEPEYRAVTDPAIADKFDLILTYREDLLAKPGGRFVFTPYAGSWIPREYAKLYPKKKNISFLLGEKRSSSGHIFRHDAARLLGDDEVAFFGIRGQPVNYSWQTKLQVLADFRYTIISETCREDNLFTEILLDCFACGTIPIFWGCPNIDHFFDELGVLQVETAEQAVEIIRELNGGDNAERFYAAMTKSLVYNSHLLNQYRVCEDWMYLNILRSWL